MYMCYAMCFIIVLCIYTYHTHTERRKTCKMLPLFEAMPLGGHLAGQGLELRAALQKAARKA